MSTPPRRTPPLRRCLATMASAAVLGLAACGGGSGGTTTPPPNSPPAAAPTITTPATASSTTVTGTTVNLNALGAHSGGEANLLYTWAATGTPPAAVSFSRSGTNAAKSVTATFASAGSYTLQVTVRDAASQTVTSQVNITVTQAFTSVNVSPANATVASGLTQQFTTSARDQFGNAMPAAATTWSVSGGGMINASTGLFTATTASNTQYTVTATTAGRSASTGLTVVTAGSLPRWEDISPPGINYVHTKPPAGEYNFGPHGMAVAPSNGQVIYIGTTAQGIFKSTDGGSSWLGRVDRTSYDCFGNVVNENTAGVASGRNWTLEVDPTNPNVVYTTAGFGNIQGVWKSTDGGVSWRQKLCPGAAGPQVPLQGDIGTIKIDPHDPRHLLVATHSAWVDRSGATYADAGLYESHDGGDTYVGHPPTLFPGVRTNVWVDFLGKRDDGSDDTDGRYWILSSQDGGAWRTSNAGATWNRVTWLPAGTTHNRSHGGTDMYRSRVNNALYLGFDGIVGLSRDNGITWQDAGAPHSADGYAGIVGDGTYLYTMPSNTGVASTFEQTGTRAPFRYSRESDGTSWSAYNDQVFSNGPLKMAFDPVHGYVYAMNWCAGIWRLKVR